MRRSGMVAVGALLACVMVLATLLAGCSSPTVPDVTGKTADDAVRILQDAGYKLGATTRVYTTGVEAGRVFQQTPTAGSKLAKGEPVSIRIALPLGEFIVPGVTGKTAEEASAAIVAASLTPLAQEQYSDSVAAGSVIAQVPEAGARVDLHATVAYVVSRGKAPASAKVPSIQGKSKTDAEKAIKDAGLVPAAEQVYSTSVARDIVIIQNPAAGATVAPGSTVHFTVSLGKPASDSVSVPNVTGKSESAATSALQSAGLVVTVYRQSSATVAKGVVSAQMPPAGTQTARGGTVGIVVSTGPDALVAVPSVVGNTEAQAKTAIESAGLVMQTVDQPSADVAKGSVIAQSPVAGSKAPAGSTVIVAISTGTPPEQK